MEPRVIWTEKCEAARGIADEFGTHWALASLICGWLESIIGDGGATMFTNQRITIAAVCLIVGLLGGLLKLAVDHVREAAGRTSSL
jgi:hypothetical protein